MEILTSNFEMFYPPRTKAVCPPGDNPVRRMWEKFSDAIVQFKLNGSRNMTVIHPDGRIEMFNRGGPNQRPILHKQYRLTPIMKGEIESLNLKKGMLHVLDGELIHAKTKDVKDVLYLFDLLVFEDQLLLGMDYATRYDKLLRIVGPRFFPLDFAPKEGKMYIAQSFGMDRCEWAWLEAQKSDYCEGLVLKRTGSISRLMPGENEINNGAFMSRMRKPKKNYRH
jgi:ATP-dependent DNA ligase